MSATIPSDLLSLPQGGGAVQGLGEKFSPDLFTGTGNFSIPIDLPAGRGGFQPSLSFAYSSGTGNGPLGLGWRFGVSEIRRQTSHGVPRYQGQDTFLLAGGEELVQVAVDGDVTRYRPRIEAKFDRIERQRTQDGDFWRIRHKDGSMSFYGTPEGSWVEDPAVIADPGDPSRIFSWHLTARVDPFGNRIEYDYLRDRGQDGPHQFDQLYLERIRYADYEQNSTPGFLISVQCHYQARPDAFSNRRAGFEIRTRRRLERLEIRTHTDVDHLSRVYHLDYLDSEVAVEEGNTATASEQTARLPANGLSLLVRIRAVGQDGETTQELPPVELDYSAFELDRRDLLRLEGDLPTVSLADPDLELVDLTGQGLPDMLETGDQGVRVWRNLGRGRFGAPRLMPDAPAGLRLSDPGVQLFDADGDGRIDLHIAEGRDAGSYSSSVDGTWDRRSLRRSAVAPSFDFEDPEVQLLDLSGDGITDVLRSGSRLECFFYHPEDGWSRTRTVERGDLSRFPAISFADPRLRWADVSGDGLQDAVLLHDGNIEYWPNLGHGDWGHPIAMAHSPRFPHGYNPERILLGDVDGDGLADLIYVDDTRVTLWLNRGGDAWSEPFEIRGTPAMSDAVHVRLVDLLGTGVKGILWSGSSDSVSRSQSYFLDLTGGAKPYLLRQVDNRLGAVTRVEYVPSTHCYLQDTVRGESRWRTTLPFPVQVVHRIESLDALSGGKMTTEFRYHHGTWDGYEREFRGFARVDQRDTETLEQFHAEPGGEAAFESVDAVNFSPPMETRHWFHVGPVASGRQDWVEPDLLHEIWSGDPNMLERPSEISALLAALPRRARREALVAWRGQSLRTELYARDGSPREDRPYSVTEFLYGLREEEPPSVGDDRRRIFFPHPLGERKSQWERGNEPLTQCVFSAEYDAYGQSRATVELAVPRGRGLAMPAVAEQPMIASAMWVDFAQVDTPVRYQVDRVCRTTGYEIHDDGSLGVLELRAAILNSTAARSIQSQTISYYDGEPFVGLPWGQLGDYGALVRSKTLTLTEQQLASAWRTGDAVLDPPEMPAWLAPDGPSWSVEYPAAFQGAISPLAGHTFHDGTDEHHRGYFVTGQRVQYDFHSLDGTHRGLAAVYRDAMAQDVSVAYDGYGLLPVEITDAIGLTTHAQYDDRTLQPAEVTGPNGNRTSYGYSPLGLLSWVAVRGEVGVAEGDTPQTPGTRFEHDLLAFHQRSQPASLRTIRRLHHTHDLEVALPERDQTVELIEYSDGWGRVLQTRAAAEDLMFGEALPGRPAVGDVGLSTDLAQAPNDAIGAANAAADPSRVVVSGWQVYDNKGRVVERYEPFFSSGWDFSAGAENSLGNRIRNFFDPLGRIQRVIQTDDSEKRWVYGVPVALDQPDTFEPTPWESYTYSASDNAGRAAATGATSDPSHWDTPRSVEIDALGRIVRAVSRLGTGPADEVVVLSEYDLRGNLLTVTDALGRVASRHEFDFADRLIRSDSIDAGWKQMSYDALGREVEVRDAKGALELTIYDVLGRISAIWARNNVGGAVKLCQQVEYGDAGDPNQDPAERLAQRQKNRLGKPHRHFDEAGLMVFDGYDFKGNVVDRIRRVVGDAAVLTPFTQPPNNWQLETFSVDWQDPAAELLLEAQEYRLTQRYDAVNRLESLRYPMDADGERKQLSFRYNRAGNLESAALDGQPFVQHVAYSASGQRLLVAHGNGVMTRYAYHPNSLRLARLRSESFTLETLAGQPTYRSAGPVLQDFGYGYDPEGNVVAIQDRSPGSGTPNSSLGLNALDRLFNYDPLDRLVTASGREVAPSPAASPWNGTVRSQDPTLTRAYHESYQYDVAGNLLTLQHQAASGAYTRQFNLGSGTGPAESNRLHRLSVGQTDVDYHYDAVGNLLRESTSRHFEWDHVDRLRSFRTQTAGAEASVHATYLYDAAGQRVKKLVRKQGGDYEVTAYIDGFFEHHRKVQGSTVLEHDTLDVIDGASRIASVRIGVAFPGDSRPAIRYQLGDHVGSIQCVVDDTGAWVQREEHTPFGESSFGGYARKRYRFTGKRRDSESGLCYHGARYYAPWLARWSSADPAGLVDGPNLYAYVRANPLRLTDPSGLSSIKARTTEAVRIKQSADAIGESLANSEQRLTTLKQEMKAALRGPKDRLFKEVVKDIKAEERLVHQQVRSLRVQAKKLLSRAQGVKGPIFGGGFRNRPRMAAQDYLRPAIKSLKSHISRLTRLDRALHLFARAVKTVRNLVIRGGGGGGGKGGGGANFGSRSRVGGGRGGFAGGASGRGLSGRVRPRGIPRGGFKPGGLGPLTIVQGGLVVYEVATAETREEAIEAGVLGTIEVVAWVVHPVLGLVATLIIVAATSTPSTPQEQFSGVQGGSAAPEEMGIQPSQ